MLININERYIFRKRYVIILSGIYT